MLLSNRIRRLTSTNSAWSEHPASVHGVNPGSWGGGAIFGCFL